MKCNFKDIICADYITNLNQYREEMDLLITDNNKMRVRITELEAGQVTVPPGIPTGQLPPFKLYERSGEWLWAQLMALRSQGCGLDIKPLLDATYMVMSEADLKVAIRWLGLEKLKYKSERRDCDNFTKIAYALLDIYFGSEASGPTVDWSTKHMYGTAVCMEGAGIWEPQNATFSRDMANRNMNMYAMKKTSPNNGYIQL